MRLSGAHLGAEEETAIGGWGDIFHRPSLLYAEEREEVQAGTSGRRWTPASNRTGEQAVRAGVPYSGWLTGGPTVGI
jgi:hypothetical protein